MEEKELNAELIQLIEDKVRALMAEKDENPDRAETLDERERLLRQRELRAETVDAVKTFQKKSGLETDGIYGSNTHKSLTAALEALKEPKPVQTTVVVLSTEDGSVNVRAGNGTQYAILRSAKAGDTFNYVATAANGWNAVEIDNQVGWVSGRYSKII